MGSPRGMAAAAAGVPVSYAAQRAVIVVQSGEQPPALVGGELGGPVGLPVEPGGFPGDPGGGRVPGDGGEAGAGGGEQPGVGLDEGGGGDGVAAGVVGQGPVGEVGGAALGVVDGGGVGEVAAPGVRRAARTLDGDWTRGNRPTRTAAPVRRGSCGRRRENVVPGAYRRPTQVRGGGGPWKENSLVVRGGEFDVRGERGGAVQRDRPVRGGREPGLPAVGRIARRTPGPPPAPPPPTRPAARPRPGIRPAARRCTGRSSGSAVCAPAAASALLPAGGAVRGVHGGERGRDPGRRLRVPGGDLAGQVAGGARVEGQFGEQQHPVAGRRRPGPPAASGTAAHRGAGAGRVAGLQQRLAAQHVGFDAEGGGGGQHPGGGGGPAGGEGGVGGGDPHARVDRHSRQVAGEQQQAGPVGAGGVVGGVQGPPERRRLVTGGGEVPGRLGGRGQVGQPLVQLHPGVGVEQAGRGLGHVRRHGQVAVVGQRRSDRRRTGRRRPGPAAPPGRAGPAGRGRPARYGRGGADRPGRPRWRRPPGRRPRAAASRRRTGQGGHGQGAAAGPGHDRPQRRVVELRSGPRGPGPGRRRGSGVARPATPSPPPAGPRAGGAGCGQRRRPGSARPRAAARRGWPASAYCRSSRTSSPPRTRDRTASASRCTS